MPAQGSIASDDLVWLLTRKNTAYVHKRPGAHKIFSCERGNLQGIHSPKYSGLANRKTVDISASESGKGLTVSWKDPEASPFAVQSALKSWEVKKGGLGAAHEVISLLPQTGREGLYKVATRRTYEVLKAQKGDRKPQRVRTARPVKYIEVEAEVDEEDVPQAFHLPLVGQIPSSGNLTNPAAHHRFHVTGKGETLLVVATEEQVLAGIYPQNGELAVLAWTTPSASDLHAVFSTTGKLRWKQEGQRDACEGRQAEVAVADEGVVVKCGEMVRYLALVDGGERWTQAIAGETRLASNAQQLTLFRTNGGKLHLQSLDAASGAEDVAITSSVAPPVASFFVTLSRRSSTDSHVAAIWLDKGSIGGARHDGPNIKQLKPLKLAGVDSLVDVGVADRGVLVALDAAKKVATVVALTDVGELAICGTFAVDPAGPSFATYADPDGGVHLAYLNFSPVLGLASLQIWSQTPDSSQGMISAHSFPLAQDEFEGMRGLALQVLPLRSSTKSFAPALSRVAVFTASGALQMWESDSLKWTREEGLTKVDLGMSAADLAAYPSFLFASTSTRSVYALSTAPESFVVKWKAVVTAEAAPELTTSSLTLEMLNEGPVVALGDGSRLALKSGERVKYSGSEAFKASQPVEAGQRPTIAVETVGQRTVIGKNAGAEADLTPAWSFSVPRGQRLRGVNAQVPPSHTSDPFNSRTTLLSIASSDVISGESLLTLLDAETGSLIAQLPGIEDAQIVWDKSIKGWKVIATKLGNEQGSTKIEVYKLIPASSNGKLAITASSLVLPGSLTPLSISLTPLRLAQPTLLLQDRLGRILAAPIRWLEAVAAGKITLGGPGGQGIWTLSGLLPTRPSHFTHFLSPLPGTSSTLRASQTALWLTGSTDLFAAVFAPSRAFERLGEGYSKVQVGIAVGVLLVGVVGTKGWAASTRTKQLWGL
ncbi:hypothetical protein JCM11641_007097 [Rhodosporidiobolus odoratus]